MGKRKKPGNPARRPRTIQTVLLLMAASIAPAYAQEIPSPHDAYAGLAGAPPSRTSLAYPQSVFVDAARGQIWVADFDNNRVLRFDVAALTGVAEQPDAETPGALALQQNYPNPFNPNTQIAFALPKTEYATLTVFDLLGREAATLFAGTAAAHKRYTVSVNAANLPSGLYFYALRSASRYEVKTMIVLK